MNKKVILVLDKLDYKKREADYISILKNQFDQVEIIYTEYEDNVIRKVRNWKFVGSIFQHLLCWKKSWKYAKEVIKTSATAIICINPIVGIFLGMMNKNSKKNIILCGFLFEPKSNPVYYALRKKVVVKCLRGVKYAVVYAKQEIEYYRRLFPKNDKFVFVPYGLDYIVENEYQGKLSESYIFSGGGSNRDYKTLIEAYNMLEKEEKVPPLLIATMPRCLEGLDLKHVEVRNDVVLETFGNVMVRSKFLVLSLKDTELSAGHQVLLEAMKNNVPIIVNRIRAVEDYVTDKDVIFYESGNANELAAKMKEMLKNPREVETSQVYEEKYSFKVFLLRLTKLV